MNKLLPFAALAAFASVGCSSQAARDSEPSGSELFARHCQGCHGHDGEGGGPTAAAMQITPPNLRTLRMRNGGTFPRDEVTAYIDGRRTPMAHMMRQMPVWGDVFQQSGGRASATARIDAIVAFIERLQYR
jgi:mono/diheme cytochrome c family protein